MSLSSQTLFGVNLSGLEDTNIFPGIAGTNYGLPTDAEIAYYASQGMNAIRLPFSWERMEPTLNGPLNSTYLSYVQGLVSYAATLGVTVILDCHNYGFYDLNGTETQIGTGGVTVAAFAYFWQQMATTFVNSPNVIFDLMNEPQFTTTGADATPASTQLWISAQVAAIQSIRGTGAAQEILISKPNTDHAFDFMGSNFEQQLTQLMGTSGSPFSYGNVVLEFHQYFDPNNSGDYTGPITDPNIGAEDLQAATAWARQYGVRLILGETDFPTDAQSQLAEANLITFLQQNSDVWQGATLWGGGPSPWNPIWNASGSDGLATDPGLNGATAPMIATFNASTEPSVLYKYFFGSNASYTAAASSNTAYYGNNNVIGAPSGAIVFVSGNGNTINGNSNDTLSVDGSGDTVNVSGSGDIVQIGGNGQGASNANLDTVNAANGGYIYEADNSRVDFYGSGVTANIGSSDTLGAYGSSLTVNASGTNDQVWIGGNGANESLDDIVYFSNGGAIYENDSSRVDFYGSNVTANIGSSDTLGAYGSSLTVNASGTNDQVWIGGNGANESLNDIVYFSNGGTVYENDNSRVDFYGSGVTANIGSNDTLGAYGSSLTVNASGTNDQIWIGGNGANESLNDVVYFSNGGAVYENSNSRADVTGSNVTATLGANDLFGLYGANDTITLGSNDSIWLNPGVSGDKLVFGGNTGATNVTSFSQGDIIDLLGGTGGYSSASAAYSALKSDGSGGSLLSLGTNGSIDIIGVAASSLSAANFKIG